MGVVDHMDNSRKFEPRKLKNISLKSAQIEA